MTALISQASAAQPVAATPSAPNFAFVPQSDRSPAQSNAFLAQSDTFSSPQFSFGAPAMASGYHSRLLRLLEPLLRFIGKFFKVLQLSYHNAG